MDLMDIDLKVSLEIWTRQFEWLMCSICNNTAGHKDRNECDIHLRHGLDDVYW